MAETVLESEQLLTLIEVRYEGNLLYPSTPSPLPLILPSWLSSETSPDSRPLSFLWSESLRLLALTNAILEDDGEF